MVCSLPVSSVHGISQVRILERVAISFSRALPDQGFESASLVSPELAGGFFTSWVSCYWKGGPLPGPESGLLSNTWKLIVSKETRMLTKQETFLGSVARVESSRLRGPRRTAWPCGSQSWVLWWWSEFLCCLWPIIMTEGPFWWCMACSAKMDANEKDSGRW